MGKATSLYGEISDYCARLGQARLLVQAAGGNVSWKDQGTLWIKASGSWLADAVRKDIFVPVDLTACQQAKAQGNFGHTAQALAGHTLRPSIETMLHALMPHKVVVHLHPVDVVAHLVRTDSEIHLTAILSDRHDWALVPYRKPGAELAHAVAAALEHRNEDLRVIFLQSHGLIVGAESVSEVDEVLNEVLQKLQITPWINNSARPAPNFQPPSEIQSCGYRVCTHIALHQLALHEALFNRLQHDWALWPDHVVFLGAQAMCARSTVKMVLSSGQDRPPFIFVQGLGVLERTDITPAQQAQLGFYLDVMQRQPVEQSLVSLAPSMVADLLNWDAEKYRQMLNRTSASQ